jgi:hypothetical protein
MAGIDRFTLNRSKSDTNWAWPDMGSSAFILLLAPGVKPFRAFWRLAGGTRLARGDDIHARLGLNPARVISHLNIHI